MLYVFEGRKESRCSNNSYSLTTFQLFWSGKSNAQDKVQLTVKTDKRKGVGGPVTYGTNIIKCSAIYGTEKVIVF